MLFLLFIVWFGVNMNFPNFAESFFVSQGFEKVSGESKTVFLIPSCDCVIKLPIGKSGSEHNFGEWNFFQKTHGLPFHPFIQPTLFSLKHFDEEKNESWINIQKIGHRACSMSPGDFTRQMLILTDLEADDDQHHFYKQDNFFFDRTGKLRMVDYGSIMTQEIIRKYGERIYHQFDERKQFSEDEKKEIDDRLVNSKF